MKKAAAEGLRKLTFPQRAHSNLGDTLGLERQYSLAMLDLDKILPSREQPRRRTSQKKLEELTLSIRERGVLQPIRVREIKTNAEYEIVAGIKSGQPIQGLRRMNMSGPRGSEPDIDVRQVGHRSRNR